MADYYMDTDGGSDANGGTSWADAKLTMEGLLAVMLAGDRGFIQGLTQDVSATARTFTFPGTRTQPNFIFGVADGTTNEPPLSSDLAVTLPEVGNTGGGNDLELDGIAEIHNIHISNQRILQNMTGSNFYDCEFTSTNTINPTSQTYYNCLFNMNSGGGFSSGNAQWVTRFFNCDIRKGTSDGALHPTNVYGAFEYYGCDFTQGTNVFNIMNGAPLAGRNPKISFINCTLDPAISTTTGLPQDNSIEYYIKFFNCGLETSVGDTSSIQRYREENFFGTINRNDTVARSNGAYDVVGDYSFEMTPRSDYTTENSNQALRCPDLVDYVKAGAQTATVYFCNDGGVDYNQDEIRCILLYPDSADTAQYDVAYSSGAFNGLDGTTTAVTDDTTSVWSGTGANPQKFEFAITPGYEGIIIAKIQVCKKQITPDSVFVDPKIEII